MAPDGDASGRVSGKTSVRSGGAGKSPPPPEFVCRQIAAQVLDAVPHPVFWKDCEGVYLGCNERFAQAVGLGSSSEIVGKTDFDLPWPREEAEAYRAEDRAVIESGRPRGHIVEPLQQADGTRLWIDTTKLPLRTEDGGICGVVGFYEDITERKEAEETVRQERHFSESAIEAMPGVFLVFDESGRLAKWNRNVETVTGYAAEEIAGQTVYQMIRRDCWEEVAESIRDTFAQGSGGVETVLVAKDGRETPFCFQGMRVIRDGKPCVIGVGIDISERKKAEAELERTRLLLEAVVEQSPVPIVLAHARERKIGIANRAAREFLGKTDEPDYTGMPLAESYRRQTWRDILPDGTPTPPEKLPLARTLQGETFTNADYGVIRKDGTRRWASISGTPIRGRDGELIAGLIVFSDITERKAADESLRESEERFRRVAELTGQLIYDWDFASGAVHWSGRLREITGYAPDEMNARGLAGWQEYVHPEDLGHAMAVLDVAIRDRRTHHCEYRFRKADGTYMHVSDEGACLYDDAGRAHRMMGVIKDVTERKQAEETLQLNEARLEALLRLNQMTEASLTEIAEFAMEEAVRLTRSKLGYIAFAGEDESTLTMFAWSKGAMAECAVQDRPVEYVVTETGLWDEAVRQRRPIITNDCAVPNPWKKGTPAGHVAVQRHMNVPVFDGDRIVIVAGVGNKESDYDESDVRQLTLLMSGMWRIVQRKQAEEKLRESETKYRALFEAAGDAILLLRGDNGQLHVVECNQRALEMFGATREQIRELPISHFWAPQQADGSSSVEIGPAHARQAAETGMVFFEWRHRRRDGTVFDTDVALSRVSLGSGRDLLAVVRDVTERKQIEADTQRRERLLDNIVGQNPYAIWISDAQGMLIRINRACCDLLGIAEEDVIHRYNVLQDDIVREQGFMPLVESVFNEGKTARFTLDYDMARWTLGRHGPAKHVILEVTISPVKDEHGTITNAVIMHHDITQRMQAENELRESERKYRALSQEFQSILGAIPGSLVLLSPDLKVVWANEYTKNTSMGFETGEMLGQYCYRCRHGLSEPCEACPVQRCFVSGIPEFGDRDTPNGKIWELHAAPVFDDQGEISGVIEIAFEVTEYRRADRELKESESRLRGLFQAAPIGIIFVKNRTTVSVNEFLCDLLGYSQAEFVGESSRHLYFTQEEFEEVGRKLYGPAPAGGHAHIEARLRRKDGTAVDVLLTGSVLRPDDPSAGHVVTVQDITERKRAERALRAAEERWQFALEGSGDGVWDWNAQTKEVFFSRQWKAMLGYAEDEVGGNFAEWEERVHPDDLPRARADLERHLSGQTATYVSEHRMRCRDGRWKWILDRGKVVSRTPDGRPLRMVGTHTDLTDRKRAETELLAEKQFTEKLLESLPGIFFLYDSTCHLKRWNKAHETAMGFTADELRDWYIADWHETPEDAAVGMALVKSVLDTGVGGAFETTLVNKKGRFVPYLINIARLMTPDGPFMMGVGIDITERRRIEEERTRLTAILDSTSDVVVMNDPGGGLFYLNAAGRRLLGWDEDAALDTHDLSELYPTWAHRLLRDEALPAVNQTGFWQGETAILDAGGREISVSQLLMAHRAADGHVEHYSSIMRDITERKRAEETLRRTNETLQALVTASPLAIVTYGADRKVTQWSPAAEKIFGWSAAEVVGRPYPLALPEDEKEADSTIEQALHGVGIHVQDRVRRRKDGSLVDVSVSTAPLRDAAGNIVGAMSILADVSEHRRADRELKASESTLRSVFRAAPIGIAFTRDRVILNANDSMSELTGYSLDELLHHGARLLYSDPEEYEEVGRCLYVEAGQGRHASMESRFRRKDGTFIDVLLTGSVLRPEDPAAGYVVTVQDITERKRAEQALQSRLVAMTRPLDDTATITFSDLFDLEEIQKLQDAFTESSGTAQLITDPDGTPITRPSGFCRLCAEFIRKSEKGRQRCHLSDSSLGQVCIDGPTVRPCLSAGLWGAGASIMVGGKHVANWLIGQVRNERLDLEQIARYAEEIGVDPEAFRRALEEVPVMSEEQFRRVAHTLFILSKELSTKAYQNVQQARFIADLNRMEEERDRLFNLSIDMLCIAGFDGRFKQVNPAWTRALGWSAAELTEPVFLDLVHPDDVPATVASVDRLRQGLEVRSFENRYRRKDGTYRWLSWNSYPLLEQELIFAVCRDVTEQKAAEEERARLERQLRQSQKMEAVGQLAGGVAHDFNNILTAILGNVDLMQQALASQTPPNDAPMIELKEVERGALRAADLTRQLLLFSRRGLAQPEALNLNQTLEDAAKMLQRLLTENVRLELRLASDLSPVWADGGQMEQVIVNLVVNARDAMPDGGRIVVETSNELLDETYTEAHPNTHPGPHVLLAVSDTGVGMSRETLERVFEPFFTTKSVGQGTGLGLATVYGIVTQAGGHITVYSEVGRGSTFRVYLPALTTPVEDAPVAAPAVESSVGGTETILVCEDDDSVRQLVTHMLRQAGYTVLTAANGEDALRQAAEHERTIHLLITDVIMPDINGRRLTETLQEQRPALRTLFMSGYTADIIAHHGVLDDNVEFLAKPFSRRDLLRRIREVLDGVRPDPPPE
ncbi:MAG: PAS domain S-box protein [Phycisphaerae bacterium]|nr:PAS domain S-box protein [Phycisphaerae bacterium]